MDHILIEVSHSEIVGKDKLDFDLFNTHGEIIHKKGQKLDPGSLLMLNYTRVYKMDEIDNTEQDQLKKNADKFIREMLLLGVRKGASKIFIESDTNNVNINLIINGNIDDSTSLDLSYFPYIVTKLRTFAHLEEKNEYQKSDFYISLFNRQINLKFSYYSSDKSQKIILEILDAEKKQIESLEQLGFSESIFRKLEDFLKKRGAILFLSGSSDLGKSTIINAIINYFNDKDKAITLLNEVPDKIDSEITVINSLKDFYDISSLFQTDLNNKLIIININTENVVETIKSLNKINVLFDLSIGILSQKLVKKLCNSCKEKFKLTDKEINDIFIWDNATEVYFYKSKGCIVCNNTGFSGRIPIHEFFEFDSKFFNSLAKNYSEKEILQQIKSLGFQSSRYDGIKKVLYGFTTINEMDEI
ncbi:MAG: hypothetical protein A2287_03285 [Candidatus Melainabacteria bacterium RIFOXYA12_FULL_32_12]|nr:MAG: hypothetical protein A2255_06105 [Candidatus Melainabacteria bacterium RIFOXYA2_FULL_32_9]OGI30524.1 MAG: hypothetical protein A2287_03285 [Candidatus Melainabacteria bacterium RIFOXYA12_FULL_32_12]